MVIIWVYCNIINVVKCSTLLFDVVFTYFYFQDDSSSSVMIITSYWLLSVRVPKAVIQSSVF